MYVTGSGLVLGGGGWSVQGSFSEEVELEAKSEGGEVNRQRLSGT